MEFSREFGGSHFTQPSPNGSLIASIVHPRLVLRSTSTLQVKRIIPLDPDFASRVSSVKWSPYLNNSFTSPAWHGIPVIGKRRSGVDKSEEEGGGRQRVLLADDQSIQVYDVEDEEWTAIIKQGFGGIRHVQFGRNADEVVVFSEFQLKVTVWNLTSSKLIEILNPKFPTRGYGYRPCTAHFALLTRSSTHDVISVHQHTSYKLASSFTLPTLDAQGLKWSPCGRWIAVWDSAASGYKVLVYTADGHLYRTYEKPCDGLGVKSVEWSPGGDFLTIGSYDGRLAFLSNYTFSPVIEMNHTRTIKLPGVTVWSECTNSSRERYYAQAQQPTTLPIIPSGPSDSQSKLGISTIAFNKPDGTLIATRNDSMPTTVWIWSLKLLRPYAVLVQLNPIRSISWHPTIPDLLMIQCAPSGDGNSAETSKQQGVVYLWSAAWTQPRAVTVPMERLSGNTWARWILTAPPSNVVSAPFSASTTSPGPFVMERRSRSPDKMEDRKPMVMFGDKDGFVVGYVQDEPELEDVEGSVGGVGVGYQQKRSWDPADWEYFAQADKLSKRSLSSASQAPPHPNPGSGKNLRGGLGSVVNSSSGSNGLSSPGAMDGDDSFDCRSWGQNVRVSS
ncbi:YVTN repeat-like/Quino protein amine dehydrogenase [Tuber magnatum]|uniref:YVTN repeat-like/Quino protein amine dehydrogenase n=1 Tax=Tuber magnatum TaxID=42249 RepID=A0A317T0D6_9PEZI|nr:YVTN repeat-like/Quino protein amine dehydrogenase [Tuber magnatum]